MYRCFAMILIGYRIVAGRRWGGGAMIDPDGKCSRAKGWSWNGVCISAILGWRVYRASVNRHRSVSANTLTISRLFWINLKSIRWLMPASTNIRKKTNAPMTSELKNRFEFLCKISPPGKRHNDRKAHTQDWPKCEHTSSRLINRLLLCRSFHCHHLSFSSVICTSASSFLAKAQLACFVMSPACPNTSHLFHSEEYPSEQVRHCNAL